MRTIIQPRSPNLLYISPIFNRFVPHASSSAVVTKLLPIFSSCMNCITNQNFLVHNSLYCQIVDSYTCQTNVNLSSVRDKETKIINKKKQHCTFTKKVNFFSIKGPLNWLLDFNGYFINYKYGFLFTSTRKIKCNYGESHCFQIIKTRNKPTTFSWSAAILFVHRYTAGSTSAGDKANKLCDRQVTCR